MSMFKAMDISASGLTAQRFRMDVISGKHREHGYDQDGGRRTLSPQGYGV